MRIIETRRAPNPRRVGIFLAEKGLEVAREERDVMAGDLKCDDFAALNPWQRVPILVLDDGRVIAESVAICRYFEEVCPEPPLFGTGSVGKAEVEMWNRRMEFGLFGAVASFFRHLHPKMAHLEVPQVEAWGQINKDKLNVELARLDRRLAESRFISGPNYSIADITALVAVDFMKPAGLGKPDAFGNVIRWHREVSARPSAAAGRR
ncbi:MAG TPA: glutathione S-transferase [Hyphomicrobium sp.]|jgi:glutathione S-transferase|uniref:glutathione S-transferase family protein n=1 Tax=Hyphomicrobium sp. TaxID=82 RepID=UPI002C69C25C|nr:glutathione S-transferase [Hyphomicrobium sp.]HXE00422.1 glutathione S-transferase [Hyphomicrobium sp.]